MDTSIVSDRGHRAPANCKACPSRGTCRDRPEIAIQVDGKPVSRPAPDHRHARWLEAGT